MEGKQTEDEKSCWIALSRSCNVVSDTDVDTTVALLDPLKKKTSALLDDHPLARHHRLTVLLPRKTRVGLASRSTAVENSRVAQRDFRVLRVRPEVIANC